MKAKIFAVNQRKKIILAALAFIGWNSSSSLLSQTAYYREVYYTVDTIYSKPKCNRVMINSGAQLDFNGDASGVNVGIYGYGRLNVGRIVVSGLAVVPIPGFAYTDQGALYNIQEATAVLCFKASSSVPKGTTKATVTTPDMGREPTLFKTGGTFKFISPQRWTSSSVDYSTQTYGPSANAPYGKEVTTKTTKTSSGVSNVTQTRKSDAYLNVPKYSLAGLSGGVFHWTRPNSISGVVNVAGISFGLVAISNKKAKYRFHYTERENDVEVNGVGKYKVTKTDRTRKKGSKIGRTNTSTDFGLEFFYAPVVIFDRDQYVVKSATDTVGTLMDIKKKHWGGRIRLEVRKGPISLRYELGLRPGVKAKVGGIHGEDNFATRLMGGAYVLFGLGIGIGAL